MLGSSEEIDSETLWGLEICCGDAIDNAEIKLRSGGSSSAAESIFRSMAIEYRVFGEGVTLCFYFLPLIFAKEGFLFGVDFMQTFPFVSCSLDFSYFFFFFWKMSRKLRIAQKVGIVHAASERENERAEVAKLGLL